MCLQGLVLIGRVLLIHCPQAACGREVTNQGSADSPNTIKMTSASNGERDESSSINQSIDEREDNLQYLKIVAELIKQKNKDVEVRNQWCHVGAVLDRLMFLFMLVFMAYMIYGMNSTMFADS